MVASKVAIILVKFNAPFFERKAIAAVLAATEYPNYTLLAHQNEPGIGLAKCWNRLIAAQDAEYICLLNTDTVVTPGWLSKLAGVLDKNPAVAAVVPSSNRVHMSEISTPLAREEMDEAKIDEFAATLTDEQQDLETCSAMCVVFRKSVWESVGGFCEQFFLYGEDTEFFYRIAKLGGRIVWHRGAYVHHYGSQSMAQAVSDGVLDYGNVRRHATSLWLARKEAIDRESH